MMPVNHVQSCVCHVTVLADAGTSTSNRMLTAVDLTATSVVVNKHFLNENWKFEHLKFHDNWVNLIKKLLKSTTLALFFFHHWCWLVLSHQFYDFVMLFLPVVQCVRYEMTKKAWFYSQRHVMENHVNMGQSRDLLNRSIRAREPVLSWLSDCTWKGWSAGGHASSSCWLEMWQEQQCAAVKAS